MPDMEEVTYSRAETIAAVTSFYDLLVNLYMDDAQVVRPPANGWPSIVEANGRALEAFGKSAEVVALLAHLPYIGFPNNGRDDADAMPDCVFSEWQKLFTSLVAGRITGDALCAVTEGSFAEFAQPHVFGLTMGGRETPRVILDTQLGKCTGLCTPS